jgi:hypothetical protein
LLPYFAIWSLVLVGYLVNRKLAEVYYLSFLLAILLVLFTGFRASGVDRDYSTYALGYFGAAQPLSAYFTGHARFINEPFITAIASILKFGLGLGPVSLFVTFAFMAILLKFYVIWRESAQPLLSLLIYVSIYFMLQDFTQIRAGLAAGVLMLATTRLAKHKKVEFVVLVLAAATIHYSALIYLPLVFLNGKPIGKSYVVLLAAFIVLALLNAGNGIINKILSLAVDPRLGMYLGLAARPNLWNPFVWLRVLFALWLYYKERRSEQSSEKLVILSKIYFISLFVFFFLSGNAAFSLRLREMLGVVEILLIPQLFTEAKTNKYQLEVLILVLLVYFASNIYYVGLVDKYQITVGS